MDGDKKRNAGIAALAVCIVLCLFMFGREVTAGGPPGESKNPNFGHATPATQSRANKSAGSPEEQSKDAYYQQLKFNRPDLSESELQAKTDHWWKVKNGEATVTGG